jgi:hypothetical protein
MRRESIGELLEKRSNPLKPVGKSGTPAKIVDIPENVTVLENETAVLICRVEGNPVPTFKWVKAGREVIMAENKVRCLTDGDDSQISLVLSKCKPHDEGDYTLQVRNAHGRDQVDVKLLVTTETGLDYRAVITYVYLLGGLFIYYLFLINYFYNLFFPNKRYPKLFIYFLPQKFSSLNILFK